MTPAPSVSRTLRCMALVVCGCAPLSLPTTMGGNDGGDDGLADVDGGAIEPRDGGQLVGLDRATCTYNGKSLKARNVKFVTSFPDVRVKVVTALPDFRVRMVDSLASRCGEWREVTSLPDLLVQEVDALPDFTIEYVTSFPGFP